MRIYYESAGENPPKPYVRFSIQKPTIADGYDINLKHNVYTVVVNLNVNGKSIEQLRLISQAMFEAFDAILSVDNFPNIKEVKAEYPDESMPFDAQTSCQLYESAQSIEFYFTT